MSSTPPPPRKRRWLRRILRGLATLLGVLSLAGLAAFFTRNQWLPPLVAHFASDALGKQVSLKGLRLGTTVTLAELTVQDRLATKTELHVQDLELAYHLGEGFRPVADSVSARVIDVDWKEPAPETAKDDGSESTPGAAQWKPARRRGGRLEDALPASVRIDALSVKAETSRGTLHLGPIRAEARLRPSKNMMLHVSGSPLVYVEGPGIPQPIDGTGTLEINAERADQGFKAAVLATLPGVAMVDKAVTAAVEGRTFNVVASVSKGLLEGPLWPALLTTLSGQPIALERVEVAPGGALELSVGKWQQGFKKLDLVLNVPGLRVGPAEAPIFAAPITVQLAAKDTGAEATLSAGKDVSMRAALVGILPPHLELRVDKLSVAALAKVAPGLRAVHAGVPALRDVSGTFVTTGLLPNLPVGVKAELEARLQGIDAPAKITVDYTPGTRGTVSAALRVSDATAIELTPYALEGKGRAKYTGRADLSELGPLLGRKDLGGTVELKGDVSPAEAAMPGHLQITALNLVSDAVRLPYDVPLTVDLDHLLDAKSGAATLSKMHAVIPANLDATIGKATWRDGKLTANGIAIDVQAAFLKTQGTIEDGEGLFQFKADSAVVGEGASEIELDYSIDAKTLVLPDKLAAFVNLRGSGKLGWNFGVQASGELQAEKVICAGGELSNATATMHPDGDGIILEKLQGTLFGGPARGSLRVVPLPEGLRLTLDADLENSDLAIFSQQVKPPSTNLTGTVSGRVLVSLLDKDFKDLSIDLSAPGGITVNRSLVAQMLMSQDFSGVTGGKTIEKVLEKVVGADEQRPFDAAAITLGLAEDRISGVASLKSKALNLDVDVKADPDAVWAAIESRGEVTFGGISTQ